MAVRANLKLVHSILVKSQKTPLIVGVDDHHHDMSLRLCHFLRC